MCIVSVLDMDLNGLLTWVSLLFGFVGETGNFVWFGLFTFFKTIFLFLKTLSIHIFKCPFPHPSLFPLYPFLYLCVFSLSYCHNFQTTAHLILLCFCTFKLKFYSLYVKICNTISNTNGLLLCVTSMPLIISLINPQVAC